MIKWYRADNWQLHSNTARSSTFEPDVCSVSVIPHQHKSCSVCSSGWATTVGRLLGPKMENSIKYLSKGHSDALPHREVEPKFRNLSITCPAIDQLSHAAATARLRCCFRKYLSNCSKNSTHADLPCMHAIHFALY